MAAAAPRASITSGSNQGEGTRSTTATYQHPIISRLSQPAVSQTVTVSQSSYSMSQKRRFPNYASSDSAPRGEDSRLSLAASAGPGGDVLGVRNEISSPGVEATVNGRDAASGLLQASLRGGVEIVQELVEAGVPINVISQAGSPPLSLAARQGHVEVVGYLLQRGADVNKENFEGWTPLAFAIVGGQLDVASMLLRGGADANKGNKRGETPLWLLASHHRDRIDLLRLLLEHGADMEQVCFQGGTPLCIASQNGHIKLVHALLRNGAKVGTPSACGSTALCVAAEKGIVDVAALLLRYGANPNEKLLNGGSALYMACQHGTKEHAETARLLLSKGADPNTATTHGGTPLIIAAQCGHIPVLGVLLEHEATEVDYSAPPMKLTALSIAADVGNTLAVEMLLASGADVHSADKAGITPIEAAWRNRRRGAVQLLIQHGATLVRPHDST